MAPNHFKDQRKTLRISVNEHATLSRDEKALNAVVSDISADGAFIETGDQLAEVELHVHFHLSLKITDPNGGRVQLKIQAVVVRLQNEKESHGYLSPVGFAIRFLSLSITQKALKSDVRTTAATLFPKIKDEEALWIFGNQAKLTQWRQWAVNNGPYPGYTALYYTLKFGGIDMMTLLLEHGANPNERYGIHDNPLIRAAMKGDEQAVQTLLAKGADPNLKVDGGWNALHKTTAIGYPKIVALILAAKGIDINQATDIGWTPLYCAVNNDKIEVVDLLLKDARLNPNLVEKKYLWGPIHLAAWKGNKEMVRMLLDAGADPLLQTQDGRNAITIAQQRKHTEVADLLSESTKPVARWKRKLNTMMKKR